MGITIKDIGLKRFNKKLGSQDFSELKNQVADAFANKGVEIARSLYGSETVQVTATNSREGRTSIIAKGDKVAYLEFGTGIQGKGQYPDETKLPNKKLVFYSRGATQSTDDWEYNYFKEQKVKAGIKNADKIKDYIGQKPKAQMYYTARYLDQQKSKIVRNVLRGGK